MKSAVIVGPGAAGSVLAAGLRKAGLKVALLARDAQAAARLRRSGLKVDGVRLKGFAASHRAQDLPRPDALFFCVKSYDTAAALASARGLAGPDCAVLSIQNGLAHAGPLRRAYGVRMVFGSAYFGARAEAGQVLSSGRRRVDLAAGPRNAVAAALLRALLAKSGFEGETYGSEEGLLWTKCLLNAAINPLGALTALPNGELIEREALRQLLLRALSEGAALARRRGVRLVGGSPERAALKLCKDSAANLNSMAQDLRAGRRSEADAILKPLLAAAKSPEKDAPVLFGLYRFVKGLEREPAARPRAAK